MRKTVKKMFNSFINLLAFCLFYEKVFITIQTILHIIVLISYVLHIYSVVSKDFV